MGIFNLFGKLKSSKKKVVTSIETVSYTPEQTPKYLTRIPIKPSVAVSKNGLHFEEVLLLSYAEKYLAGKTVAKFWLYDYNIADVFKILSSLEKRGFIVEGKLTELGKSEISDNEYVMYLHRHKKWCLDTEKIMQEALKNPKQWRNIIWSEFNRLYFSEGARNISKRRFIKQSMYEFVLEEKNYAAAFDCLAEVFFIDLNCYVVPEHDPTLIISPGLKNSFKPLVKELGWNDHQMVDRLVFIFNRMENIFKNYTIQDCALIITALTFDMEDVANKILRNNFK